ncbi:MAG TPA: DoxX family protein [Turneriella sp.]|nr:DoxX family protein [Turneriella sp.]HNE20678.1 DoxX family protein [Turneriella sp.]HNJ64994.1 DoxX family protein [Turneriella sp.]HNL11653.1 DoxX family protein [Turneriella sp.]
MNSIIDSVSKSGRYIFTIPLIMFGINHLTMADLMAGMVPVPGGAFWVYFTGVAMLAAAVAIITNFKGLGSLAAFLAGVLILVYVLAIHLPGVINAKDAMARMTPMMATLKDLGMVGGAWAIARLMKA